MEKRRQYVLLFNYNEIPVGDGSVNTSQAIVK